MKPKILLDLSLLGHDPSARRGMERVAYHLFAGLQKSEQVDLSFVATSHLPGAYEFLLTQGISPETKLKFRPHQLRTSRWGRKLSQTIHRSIENRSLPARALRRLLSQIVQICSAGESKFTPEMLREADIYHTPFTPFPRSVQQSGRLRKFITVHDFNPLKSPEFFSGQDTRYMENLLACLKPDNFAFCVSETVRKDILNLSTIPSERIFVTPLAADENIFYRESNPQKLAAARARYGIPEGDYFLSLSAHAPHKNFPHLIHCFSALIESGELTDTNLVIAGPNPQRNREACEALAKYSNLKSRVILVGRLPDEDMAAVYSGATAFLFPSFCEGFGMPPLEAMQCGTPVIASNTSSIPEVVGEAGILLPPKDKDAWCQAMLQLSRQAALREELRKKSLQRADFFSWPRFMEQTLRGYRASLEMQPS